MGTGTLSGVRVMTRLAGWVDFVGEKPWRIALVLIAHTAVVASLLLSLLLN